MIDYIKLKNHLPVRVFNELQECAVQYKINTPLRMAHFLAQCAHESTNFTRTRENLNYSADGLLQTFPKYFTEETANEYAHNAVRIASRVYANRMGNGDESTQDGWTYRGGGDLQLTGLNNYRAFDAVCNDDVLTTPDLVATKYPLTSAAWFWNTLNLNKLADKSDINFIVDITKKINGGTNGLNYRIKYFNSFYEAVI